MRKNFYQGEKFPLHIVGKSTGNNWPFHYFEDAWSLFSDALAQLQEDHELQTHAFVLMSNHYHWLCSYDFKSDPAIFEWFHELVNCEYLHQYQSFSPIFKSEAEIFFVKHFEYYKNLYRYVYRNPVEAGLVKKVEDYPFSTLPYILGESPLAFCCFDNMNLITDPIPTLLWLNSSDNKSNTLYH